MRPTTRHSLFAATIALLLLPYPAAATLCDTSAIKIAWYFGFIAFLGLVAVIIFGILLWGWKKRTVNNATLVAVATPRKSKRLTVALIVGAVVFLVGVAGMLIAKAKFSCDSGTVSLTMNTPVLPRNFIECAKAGNLIRESYPRTCTANGVTYTEQVVNGNTNVAGIQNINASTAGWKTHTSDSTYISENLESFDSSPVEKISYSIMYPSSWKLGGTVFDDENGNKIAELSPGAVYFDNTQNCTNLPPPDPNGWPEVELSREKIVFGTLNGMKIVSRTAVEGDNRPYWYPNRYCLERGQKAFIISFYENELGKGDSRLFDRILSTFTFTK